VPYAARAREEKVAKRKGRVHLFVLVAAAKETL
jgi:hypothetical protein